MDMPMTMMRGRLVGVVDAFSAVTLPSMQKATPSPLSSRRGPCDAEAKVRLVRINKGGYGRQGRATGDHPSRCDSDGGALCAAPRACSGLLSPLSCCNAAWCF